MHTKQEKSLQAYKTLIQTMLMAIAKYASIFFTDESTKVISIPEIHFFTTLGIHISPV
jgi:hypothetical protein